jgi:hypothetical protein
MELPELWSRSTGTFVRGQMLVDKNIPLGFRENIWLSDSPEDILDTNCTWSRQIWTKFWRKKKALKSANHVNIKNPVRTSQETFRLHNRDQIAVYCENHTKDIDTLCEPYNFRFLPLINNCVSFRISKTCTNGSTTEALFTYVTDRTFVLIHVWLTWRTSNR